MEKFTIEMKNLDPGQSLSDFYSNELFVSSNGVAFLMNGQIVSPRRAMREGFKLAKDFQPPTFFTRQEVTNWLASLGVPRGSETYVDLYSQLARSIPASMPTYEKPAHT